MAGYINKAHNAYRTNAVETQSQGKLVYMLYEGAANFLLKAEDAIEAKQIQEAHINIVKVENILYELINTLDLEVGSISSQLMSMYEYMLAQLLKANMRKDVSLLQEIRAYFEELAKTWKSIL